MTDSYQLIRQLRGLQSTITWLAYWLGDSQRFQLAAWCCELGIHAARCDQLAEALDHLEAAQIALDDAKATAAPRQIERPLERVTGIALEGEYPVH